ncbi:nucleoside triphosphate pyrophosphohydrolase [Enterovirga sp.]|uniref:nucleoside triphosphate pyrophosphohydrolase n=1 Tax=Enterovirga sp. TaxID=2026350 RepID=UPI002632F736|nr:nucleoside triphosphate pyrophosphohydrolase [Enterovirga sp.]MDB5591497.1 nucleoside triphosphate pyrophosphohydrolase [Enterovirga sp.]
MSMDPPDREQRPSRDIGELLRLMARLRDPQRGCPWDLDQTFETIAPYTVEEAHEVADAVHRGDLDDLRDELGDLLLQVVFHAQLARERGAFDFGDVVLAISSKLIRRHPHVFGDTRSLSPEGVKRLWDEIKQEERAEKAARAPTPPARPSALDGIPIGIPALSRTDKIARKAASVGFAWPDMAEVLGKVEEEIGELREALAEGRREAVAEEYGDLLFTVANLGHYLRADPEETLAKANRKFERRFRAVETKLVATGSGVGPWTLAEMDRAWDEVKREERPGLSPAAQPPDSE